MCLENGSLAELQRPVRSEIDTSESYAINLSYRIVAPEIPSEDGGDDQSPKGGKSPAAKKDDDDDEEAEVEEVKSVGALYLGSETVIFAATGKFKTNF